MKVVILLGPPGSGKGTQAKLLSQSMHGNFLGMGDIIRAEIDKATPEGLRVLSFVESGIIPPWYMVKDLFKNYIDSLSNGELLVLDGVPRNLEQVEDISTYFSLLNWETPKVIFLNVPEEILLQRMLQRRVCKSCNAPLSASHHACEFCQSITLERRKDDEKKDIILHRLAVFKQQSMEVVKYYEDKGILHTIDGTLPANKIQGEILAEVEKL